MQDQRTDVKVTVEWWEERQMLEPQGFLCLELQGAHVGTLTDAVS